jgi:hypothetical protein
MSSNLFITAQEPRKNLTNYLYLRLTINKKMLL